MGKIIAIGGAEFDQSDSRIMEVVHSLVRKTERPRMVFLPTVGHDTHGDEERANAYFGSMGYEVTHLYLTDPDLTDEDYRLSDLSALGERFALVPSAL